MKTSYLLIAFALATFPSAYASKEAGNGTGNPAAEYCEDIGGSLELVVNPAGETNNCVVEEWALYREMQDKGLVKEQHYGRGGMPNPAAVNCIDVGGSLRYAETNAGTAGFCVIEEWALFRATHPSS